MKLTSDESHLTYLTHKASPRSIHKPILYENFGVIGETKWGGSLYLLELERLRRIRCGSANAEIVRRVAEFSQEEQHVAVGCSRGYWLPRPKDFIPGLPVTLAKFFEELERFNDSCGNAEIDNEGRNNFMERADGTLVFSDPLAAFF